MKIARILLPFKTVLTVLCCWIVLQMAREQNVAAVDLDQCVQPIPFHNGFCFGCHRILEHSEPFVSANGEETNHYNFSDLIQEKGQHALAPLAKSKALVTTQEGERKLQSYYKNSCRVNGSVETTGRVATCYFEAGAAIQLIFRAPENSFVSLFKAICHLTAMLEQRVLEKSGCRGRRRLEAHVETDENPGEPPEITASSRHLPVHEELLPKESLAIDSAYYDPEIASYAFQDKPQNETTKRRLRGFRSSRQFVGIGSGARGHQVRFVKFTVWDIEPFHYRRLSNQCKTTINNKKKGKNYYWEVSCYKNDKMLESAWITWRGRGQKVHGRIFERHTLTKYWPEPTSIPVIFTCSHKDGFSALQNLRYKPLSLVATKELKAENCNTICKAYARKSHGKRKKRGTRWDAESDHAVQLA